MKKQPIIIAAIGLGTAFVCLTGCNKQETPTATPDTTTPATNSLMDKTKAAGDQVAAGAEKAGEEIKQGAENAATAVKDATTNAVADVKEKMEDTNNVPTTNMTPPVTNPASN